ncbi:DUF4198 domain-containing protein [Chitinophaga horti]|uniref:DUF4198 domain-containing protein n=1 Tax=Chitinophaga horti TaxID=2920382 RepID=A0ABY6J730_9BACT|nr:DUF4198 domain-containing protein [Chitinophaga horti]UYQ95493.1 DUF4198 domain-containing protein [Chitinophaga horti]
MMKNILLSIAFLLSALSASAHAVWIETSLIATKNKPQEVRVYLGEFADNERDQVEKWFSNMKDVQLFVIAPDGDRQQITLKANGNHYLGTFTPKMDGNYTLSVTHAVAEVYSEVKIIYYATATTIAGKPSASGLQAASALAIAPATESPEKGQKVGLKVSNEQQPLDAAKVEISSPAGWVRTLHSDKAGETSFTPLESGRYLLEAVRTEKTPGTHNGKSYKSVTHLVTHCVVVKP